MIPYEQMKSMADQKMADYQAQAERHRWIQSREHAGLIYRVLAAGRIGIERSGLGRIGEVIVGREVRPAI